MAFQRSKSLLAAVSIALGLLVSPANAGILKREDPQFLCLAYNVFKEARGEPFMGALAVAHVTINRVGKSEYGRTICEVVHKAGAFSWTGSRATVTTRIQDLRTWEAVKVIARIAMEDRDGDPTMGAVAFHTRSIRPHWVCCFTRTATIGSHIFYKVSNA